ncbi:M55 family metallopeptidase [uncultured Desulfuromonas sp.]|uniref:M55 family metallopeptidase n=1 Tax=uncultured Desulfuromonas sp. TaxID=181013 RepID=UPI002AABBE1D|nr:M55 family metallopeptidase [uncultured Desulfuromonas sp.]
MKFIIAVDCEGVACVVGEPGGSLTRSANMAFAREQATRETNAAIRALFNSGAEQVVVWDNHGDGANLIFDQLDSRGEIVLGTGFSRRFPTLDGSYAGVLMIGYHAKAGTACGVLAHTYCSAAYRCIRINGMEMGEIALDGAVAGELGVPVICVASDQHGCDEALQHMPWLETVITKEGFGRHCAKSKHPLIVEERIEQAVERAVATLDEKRPFRFDSPVMMELQFTTWCRCLKAMIRRSGWRICKAKTLRKSLPSMLEWQC